MRAVRIARSPVVFTAVSVVLVAALVPGAFLRGEVLSQGTLLYEHQPWQAHTPEDAAAANPLLYDAAFLFYPLLTHAVESVQRGQLPIWSPALYGGHPFLASFQTALFSPFTAIAYLIPLPQATVVKALAPLVVGGLGMFLFVRSLGLTPAAWWFAGLAYLLNGFAVVWIEHPLTAVACWLPWVLLATDRLVARNSVRHAVPLAAFVALVILAGHPETATKVFLLTGAYAAVLLVAQRSARWSTVAAAYAAGVLLTSVQLLPFVEYLAESEAFISRETYARNTFFLPPATIITGLVPDFFGNPASGPYHVPPNQHGVVANYAEAALYAGIPVVLLSAVGLAAYPRAWRVRFFAASTLAALALMFGAPGFVHLISATPLLRVMILTRFGLIAIVSLIVLAAYGVDSLIRAVRPTPVDGPSPAPRARGEARRHERHEDTWGAPVDERRLQRALLLATGAAALAIASAWGIGLELLRTHDLTARTAAASALALGLLLIVSTVILLRVRGTLSPVAFSLAICGVLAADLVFAGSGFHPTVPAKQVYPSVPELDLIRQDGEGPFRVYGWGNALVPNTAMAYGLQDVRGWDGMNPHRFTRLLDLGYLRQTSDPERHLRDPRLLDLLNVKYVFVDRDLALPEPRYTRVPGTRAPLYVNTRALPRAFLVDRYRVLTDAELHATLHDGSEDLGQVVLLDEELPESERPEATRGGSPGSVIVREYGDTHVELEVAAQARALLVLGDAYYPGWTATVGDRPVSIRRANYALRAVAIPPGRHNVRFEYRPLSVRLGAVVSAVTLVALVIAVLSGRRRRVPTAS